MIGFLQSIVSIDLLSVIVAVIKCLNNCQELFSYKNWSTPTNSRNKDPIRKFDAHIDKGDFHFGIHYNR